MLKSLAFSLRKIEKKKSLKGYIHGNGVNRFAFLKDHSIFSVENRLHDTGMHSGSFSAVLQIQPRYNVPSFRVIAGHTERRVGVWDIYEIKSMGIIATWGKERWLECLLVFQIS